MESSGFPSCIQVSHTTYCSAMASMMRAVEGQNAEARAAMAEATGAERHGEWAAGSERPSLAASHATGAPSEPLSMAGGDSSR